jgi:hypothetical protein
LFYGTHLENFKFRMTLRKRDEKSKDDSKPEGGDTEQPMEEEDESNMHKGGKLISYFLFH